MCVACRTNRTRSLTVFAIRRFFRIAPCYYFALLLYCFISSLIEGPRKCDAAVIRSLLFYQNNYPVTDQCMAWGWTVAVEVQFYILAPLILFLPSLLGSLCETHQWGHYLRSKSAPLLTLALPILYSVKSRADLVDENAGTNAIDPMKVLAATNHDVADPYFQVMYSATSARIFACFVGALGGVGVSILRNSMGAGGGCGDHRLLYGVANFVSFGVVVGCIFTDWIAVVKEFEGSGGAQFLIYFRVFFAGAVAAFVTSAAALTIGGGGSGAGVMKILTAPSRFLTPHPLKLPYLNPLLGVVSYPAFLLHPLTVNGAYLLVVSGDVTDNPISRNVMTNVSATMGVCVLVNAAVMVVAAAAMHVLVETPGAEMGKWVERKVKERWEREEEGGDVEEEDVEIEMVESERLIDR